MPEPLPGALPPFELGKAHLVAEGDAAAILAYGYPVVTALAARRLLASEGHLVAVYDARFAKPIDRDLIQRLVRTGIPILTVEDHQVSGGFGTCVLEACSELGLPTENLHRAGLPDRFIPHGSRREQEAEAGIDAETLASRLRPMLRTRHSAGARAAAAWRAVWT